MQQSEFRLPASDGVAVFVRSFLPDGAPRAIVQIAHGMAEHGARYARFAAALAERGLGAYVADHRGHGHTAASPDELGHFADHDGWRKVLDDQRLVLDEVKSRHAQVPVFLMGHSMGSFIVRDLLPQVARQLAGLVVSATTHEPLPLVRAARAIALVERTRLGRRGKSKVLRALTFDQYNRRVDHPRTEFDWLSRDPAEVDAYAADPLCGFMCSAQLYRDMFGGMLRAFGPDALRGVPKTLPVYILAGECDGLNNRLAGIRRFHQALESAAMSALTLRVYPGARHELLNETNRDEVTRDLVGWLEARLG
ncbi:MAG: alpha/beta hydrolase [Polyangiales bacterium]